MTLTTAVVLGAVLGWVLCDLRAVMLAALRRPRRSTLRTLDAHADALSHVLSQIDGMRCSALDFELADDQHRCKLARGHAGAHDFTDGIRFLGPVDDASDDDERETP